MTFDADGQHSPEEIARLVEPIRLGKVEVVLGSRFLSSDTVFPLWREDGSAYCAEGTKLERRDARSIYDRPMY